VSKVLFAISDTGGGHRSAAEAMIAALSKVDPNAQCTITDLLRAADVPMIRNAPEIYDYWSTRRMWVYDLFWRLTNEPYRIDVLSAIVFPRARKNIKRILRELSPDMVVVAHPLAVCLMCKARREMMANWPVVTVVTDLATIHASWAYDECDAYFVPTFEAYNALLKYGISESKIIYSGFPVHPKFLEGKIAKQEARLQLKIDPSRFTVLLTSGGAGGGKVQETLETLEAYFPAIQVLAVTGNNKNLFTSLNEREGANEWTRVYGFVDNMELLMSASDLVISKAGPGTIMEVMSMQRELIVTGALGVQETGNIDYVVNNRLGYYCPDAASLRKAVHEISERSALADIPQSKTEVKIEGSAQIAAALLEHIAENGSKSA